MKIYNEIVIDMNPESSSYGETLHEDSYDYEGDMMLMSGWEDSGFMTTDENGDVWTSRVYINMWNQIGKQEIKKNGVAVFTDEKNMNRADAQRHFNTYIRSYSVSGIDRDTVFRAEAYGVEGEGVGLAEGQIGGFTYSGGEADPTSSEFRRSVEETGGFGEIAGLYGEDPMDFEEFYGAPLEKMKQDYATGKKSLISQTGKSLSAIHGQVGNIYGQAREAERKGFESMGSMDYAKSKALKETTKKTAGVMGDYLTQQKSLSDKLAFSADEFWKTTEDDYYTEMELNQAAR